MTCPGCGAESRTTGRFCPKCGTVLTPPATPSTPSSGYSGVADTYYREPAAPPPPVQDVYHSAPMTPPPGYGAPPVQAGFKCYRCQSTYPPIVKKRISTAGWITFAVLMVVCFPLFFIGLLMKEEYRVCSTCLAPLG